MVRSSMVQLSRYQSSESHRPWPHPFHLWLAVWPCVSYLTSLFLHPSKGDISVYLRKYLQNSLRYMGAKSLIECLIQCVHKLMVSLLVSFTIQGAVAFLLTQFSCRPRASQQTFLALPIQLLHDVYSSSGLHILPWAVSLIYSHGFNYHLYASGFSIFIFRSDLFWEPRSIYLAVFWPS